MQYQLTTRDSGAVMVVAPASSANSAKDDGSVGSAKTLRRWPKAPPPFQVQPELEGQLILMPKREPLSEETASRLLRAQLIERRVAAGGFPLPPLVAAGLIVAGLFLVGLVVAGLR